MLLSYQHRKKFNHFDYTNLNGSYVTNAGSNWNDDDNTGTFYLNVNNSTSDSNDNVTAHLKFSNFACKPLNDKFGGFTYPQVRSLPCHRAKHKKPEPVSVGSKDNFEVENSGKENIKRTML